LQFGFVARANGAWFRDSDHICVVEAELLSIAAVQCTYRKRNRRNPAALRSYQGMEDTMLLFFYMPLIIASAMLQPNTKVKPVKRQED
jgi:hypothetical protein